MSAVFPRCQIVPLPDQRAAFLIDQHEVAQWVFAKSHPRPFFYPIVGPSGEGLTRMGHPGAPNHDHHRSVWFAHNKVLGIDFWSDNTTARIEQTEWVAYQDGEEDATMATTLAWKDGHDPRPLLHQELIASIRPLEDRQWTLELQSRFTPTADSLEFQKTNFGFLAVRVAKHMAEFFGEGRLTNSEGAIHERNIFGRPARWMDYSGPTRDGNREGIAYIDHPGNANPAGSDQPTRWHVREDGWMGASPCMADPLVATRAQPLVIRYLLVIHRGGADPASLNRIADAFASLPLWEVVKPDKKHTHREIRRQSGGA